MPTLMNIKKKIQSIEMTEKITKTMKLVAIANLKKDQKFFNEIKEYNQEFYNLYSFFAKEIDVKIKENKKNLFIVFSSSLGLCGSYNINLLKKIEELIDIKNDSILLFGKKGYSLLKSKNLDKHIKYYVNANPKEIKYEFCELLADKILEDIKRNEINSVKIIYNKFINSIKFEPSVLNLYPFDFNIFKKEKNDYKLNGYMTFETNPEKIISILEKQLISNLIFGALIETNVSENSSRRNAMDSASKNAKDIKEDYLIEYNNKRQSKITQEINEIIGGFNATK